VRSILIYSFAAVFAAFALLTALLAAFALPVAAIADQPSGAITTVSVTQEQSVPGFAEVLVEVRRPL